MGLFRKMLSVSTVGATDFRSDKERTAAYTRSAKRQAGIQTLLMAQHNALTRKQMKAARKVAKQTTLPFGHIASNPTPWIVSQPVQAPPAAPFSLASELERLADLRDRGALTDDEFNAQKARLLS